MKYSKDLNTLYVRAPRKWAWRCPYCYRHGHGKYLDVTLAVRALAMHIDAVHYNAETGKMNKAPVA